MGILRGFNIKTLLLGLIALTAGSAYALEQVTVINTTSNPVPVTGSLSIAPATTATNVVSTYTLVTSSYPLNVTGSFSSTIPALTTVTFNGSAQPVTQTNNPVTYTVTPGTGTFPVSGTFWQTTQPVSLASAPSTPVTGTFWQVTQPVSIASMPSTPVTGTFWQVTQPISGSISNTGFNVNNTVPVTGTFFQASQPVSLSGAQPVTSTYSVVSATYSLSVNVTQYSTLVATATAGTGAVVTAQLPAVASQFHYITLIEVTKYFTAANAASGTPLVCTTTNLPNAFALSWGQPLGTIGNTDERIYVPAAPLKSSAANTQSLITCPATVGLIWRINVMYYTAL